MKKLIGLALLILVLVVAFNDFGRWFNTRSALREETTRLVEWSESNGANMSRSQAAQELVNQASAQGVTVYQYAQDASGMQVWTQAEIKGTWVIGTVRALTAGKTFKEARTTPFVITDYGTATFR